MDQDKINHRAKMVDTENNVRQKAIRAHAALISYFDGEDPTGVIKSPTTDVYAAFIAVLTGSGMSRFEKRSRQQSDALQQDLSRAFKDVGFVGPEGELSIPGQDSYSEIPSKSVGPLLPAMVAILEVEYGIDSTQAVRRHRPESIETVLPDEEEESTVDIEKRSNRDWEANIRDAPGFQPDAEAYIYVLELERLSDSSTWFYVGKRESGYRGLLGRVRNHARKFEQSRTISYNSQEILVGDYNASMKRQGTTHHVVDIERIVSISNTELASFDTSGAESCYISEIERRTAYEVALDHETTNVLGGK